MSAFHHSNSTKKINYLSNANVITFCLEILERVPEGGICSSLITSEVKFINFDILSSHVYKITLTSNFRVLFWFQLVLLVMIGPIWKRMHFLLKKLRPF